MMEFKSNHKKVVSNLENRKRVMAFLLKQAWSDSGHAYVSKVTTEQMTGRPGLKRPTGTLAKSLWSKLTVMKDDLILQSGVAKRAWYAIVHQTGKVIRPVKATWLRFKVDNPITMGKSGKQLKRARHNWSWVSSKKVVIPKRLYIPETWGSFTIPMLRRKTAAILHMFAQGGK